jgi:hypothetical protein
MLVKAGQIVAIDSVRVDSTLSGDGIFKPIGVKAVAPSVSGHAGLSAEKVDNTVYIGMKPDAVKVVSTNETVSIEKTVGQDGTVEYNLGVSVEPVVSDTKIIGTNGISARETAPATYTIGVSGDYLKPEALNGYATETWVNSELNKTSAWAKSEFQPKDEYVVPSDLDYYYKKTDIDAYSAKVNTEFNETSAWAKSEFQSKSEMSAYYKKSEVYTKEEVDERIPSLVNYALSADVETAIAISEDWAEDTFQVKGSYASATDITSLSSTVDTKLADKADKSYVDETFQIKGNYITSADNTLSGKALVLKDNKWEEAPEGTTYTQGPNIDIHRTVISGRDWTPELSAKADKSALDDYTLKSTFETFEEFVTDEFVETSAWSLETFQPAGNYLTPTALEPYYTSSQVDTIIDNTKTWADDRFQPSGNYLSANALDDYYNKTEVDTELQDLSDAVAKTIVELSATANDKFALKTEIPEIPDIAGDLLDAKYNDTLNQYEIVGPDIVGNNGISAAFDDDNNEWNIGLSGQPVYMFDKYESNGIITAGTVIEFAGQDYEQITATNGYFELPAAAEKVTFNINENVEDNNTGLHEYLLNKFALVTDSNEVLVYTQNYYPAEVGTSNGTIAITVDHSVDPTRKYAVVYSGSDVAASANLNFTMSIYSNRI